MNIPPTTYGDLGHVMRQNNPKLLQGTFEKHDARSHIFTGALTTNEGEVLGDTFARWCKKGNMHLNQATKLFRDAEEDIAFALLKEGKGEILQRLTDEELKIYTDYFNKLVREYLKQSRESELPENLINVSILKMPDGWLA
jgi:hypothetical protein